MGRRGWGLELNPAFTKSYVRHFRRGILERFAHDAGTLSAKELRETVLNLRAVKYPKALMNGLRKEYPHLPRPRLAAALASPVLSKRNAHQLLEVTTLFVLPSRPSLEETTIEMQRALKAISCKAPLTKYGIAGDIAIVDEAEFHRALRGTSLWVYYLGRTWTAAGQIPTGGLGSYLFDTNLSSGNYAPIVANVRLNLIDDGRQPIDQDLGSGVVSDPVGRG
jgi:hypothetical protein